MNKKGFTLVELLATIVIIAIIMSLVLPSVMKVSDNNKKRIYKEYENMMVEYAKISYLNDQDLIDLIDLDELEKVKNECSGYVEIDHSTPIPTYTPYITCGDQYTSPHYNNLYAKSIVAIPVCKSDLIYNGQLQSLVAFNSGYTITNGNRKDAGKQNVTVSLIDTSEYVWADATIADITISDCEIQKRDITLAAEPKMMNYGGTVPANSYNIINGINGENPLSGSVSYTYKDVSNNNITVNSSTAVGVYNIVPSATVGSNYNLTIENGALIITQGINPISVTTPQSWNPTFATTMQEFEFEAAINGQGAVTYSIQSQKKDSTVVNSFSIPTSSTATLRMAANTGAGSYTVVIRATAAGNGNYSSGYKDITMNVTVGKKANSIAVTTPQNISATYSASTQDKSFTAATSGEGTVTYSIQSQKKGSTTVNAFSIPTNTTAAFRIAANTGVGSYTLVVRATASGNDNYSSGYKDFTINLTIGKANNPITVTASQSISATFATTSQDKSFTAANNAQGAVTYSIQSQKQGSTAVNVFSLPTSSTASVRMAASTGVGTYTVVIRATAAGNDNYNSGYKDITLSVTVGKASNPITVTTPQSWDPTFSTSLQNKSFTAATGAQGTVTYSIQSQKKGSSTVNAFSIPTNSTASVIMAASTGAGSYTVVIRATAAGNDNYSSGYKDITMNVTVAKVANPITVTGTQSISATYSTSSQDKSFTAATNAQGAVTYKIQSQKKGSTTVNSFSIPTSSSNTLRIAASTGAGTYTVVVRATAAGNDNYNSGYKDITTTVTIGKANNPITVTTPQSWNPTFSTSVQNKSFTAATGGQGTVTYSIQSQKKGSTTVNSFSIPTNSTASVRMVASTGAGSYTVVIRATAAGNDNYNSGTKDITMMVTVAKAGNPLAVTATQSWNPTFSTSSQDKSFTAATGGQGTVTYSIQSQKKGSTSVNSFSIPTNTAASVRMAASTGVGTYTVVIRASATGNDNYNSGTKDITMTVTVERASVTFPTCSSKPYNGYYQTLFAANTSDTGKYKNSAITGLLVGSYSTTLTPTGNYKWSDGSTSGKTLSCSITGVNRWECHYWSGGVPVSCNGNYASVPLTAQRWLYYDSNGNRVLSGWLQTGASFLNPASDSRKDWYYMSDGYAGLGWYQDPNDSCWYYLSTFDSGNNIVDAAALTNTTEKINGETYSFSVNGRCYAGPSCSASCNH